jgi:hypothetical protein
MPQIGRGFRQGSIAMRLLGPSLAFLLIAPAMAQAPGTVVPAPKVPEWALPDSPTHRQVPPPLDFHRAPVTFNTPIGIFENQTDVGAALVPGSASFDPSTGTYAITSAGYNIWYTRDEFRFLWKRMSGDVSLAANVAWPDADGFGDRKLVLMIRSSLDDDAANVLVGQHGAGMIQFGRREAPGSRIRDMEYRAGSRGILAGGATPDSLVTLHATRIGLEKRGDTFQMWISWQGEPMHPEGAPIILKLDGPFYVGLGLTSHLPVSTTTAKVSNVVLENRAGRIRQ